MSGLLRRVAVALRLAESAADQAYPERCIVCGLALRTMHNHGVRVMPAPTGPRPRAVPMPPRSPIEVRIVK